MIAAAKWIFVLFWLVISQNSFAKESNNSFFQHNFDLFQSGEVHLMQSSNSVVDVPCNKEIPFQKNEENREKEEQEKTNEYDDYEENHEVYFRLAQSFDPLHCIFRCEVLLSSLQSKRWKRNSISLLKLYHQWKIDLI